MSNLSSQDFNDFNINIQFSVSNQQLLRKTRKKITRETITSFLNLIKMKKVNEMMQNFNLSQSAVQSLIKLYTSVKLVKPEDHKQAITKKGEYVKNKIAEKWIVEEEILINCLKNLNE